MSRSRKGGYFGALVIFLAIFIAGCNNTDQTEREIDIDLIETRTDPPSKVRLFFKVDLSDEDDFDLSDQPDFEILEDRSQISNLESQLQIKRELGDFMYSSVLLLDLSGSILNNADLPRLKEAASSFIEKTMPEQGASLHGTREMAIYWFDGEDDIHQLAFFTTDRELLLDGVESIDENISDDVSTNLNGAVVEGLSLVDSRLTDISTGSDIAVAGSLVLFTDGTDQAARVTTADALDAVNNAGTEHSIFTIGLGGEIDENILSSFGKNGFELAEDSLALNDSFLAVAERLERESGSFYVLEYCSPKRAGNHLLQVRAIYEDRFGSFSTSFSAEGFTGGCQIE